MIFEPFYYQQIATDAFISYIKNPDTKHRNPLIVAPTGSGKSHIIALICATLLKKWPQLNIVILSHSATILIQDYEKLEAYLPEHDIGLYSAEYRRKEIKQITVAGIQSCSKQGEKFKQTHIVLVDEAHSIPPTGEGRYRTFFSSIKPRNILGLTATPFRLGSGMLTGSDHMFNSIIYEINIQRLIKEGFLSKLTSKNAKYQMDTSNIKVIAGDYSAKSLSDNIDRFNITKRICTELIKYKDKRKHWLIFAIDIDHAEHIAELLSTMGVPTGYAHSKLPKKINDLAMRMYRKGDLQALVNVEKYTTGFDYPGIDMVATLRPTKSPVLHVQMIGRGLRVIYANDTITDFDIHNQEHRLQAIQNGPKQNCLVLDFAGNLERLGPIDKVEIKEVPKGKKGGKPLTKPCPECDEVVPLSVMVCPDCGYEWEKVEQLMIEATCADVLSKPKPIKTLNVRTVYYHRHKRNSISLKVTYVCDRMQTVEEWIHFDTTGGLRTRAEMWWRFRAGTKPPFNTDEALERLTELEQPAQVEIDDNGKYPTIKRYHFTWNRKLSEIRKDIQASGSTSTTDGLSHGSSL